MNKLTLIFLVLFLTSCLKDDPSRIFIEHNHTSGEATTKFFPLKDSETEKFKSFSNDVWISKDGVTKCRIDPWKEAGSSSPTTFSLNCYTKGDMNTQVTANCINIMSKDKHISFFIGGIDEYNQNFKIWCE